MCTICVVEMVITADVQSQDKLEKRPHQRIQGKLTTHVYPEYMLISKMAL